ncbi:hypothetical protein GC173_05815 [bacterium]|nr:hypothetical protein [bacterium]
MMTRKLTWGLVLLGGCALLSACGQSPVASTDTAALVTNQYVVPDGAPVPIKVMSWNLEHFVDPFDDPYVKNEKEDTPEVKPSEVLQSLAYSIKEINPDVMILEEVESDRAVRLFLDSFLPGHDYKYYAGVEAMDWYQNVVIVSRLPIGRIVSLREREITSATQNRTRNDINNRLLGAEILGPGRSRFFVAGLHLKAGRPDADVEWRKLQAGIVQEMLAHESAAEPGLPILVAGDMNMLPKSEEYVALTEGGSIKLQSPFEKWGFPFTHTADAPERTFDYIFHNSAMEAFYAAESASVPTPLSPQDMRKISDHLPVVATYNIPQ